MVYRIHNHLNINQNQINMNTKITKKPIWRLILVAIVTILAGLNSPMSAQDATIEYVS